MNEENTLKEYARATLGAEAIKLMEHCVGYDPYRVYWRHNEKFFKPKRNRYFPGGSDTAIWKKLKQNGYADCTKSTGSYGEVVKYWLNNAGFAILSAAEGVYIYNDAASGNEVDAAPEVITVLLNHAVFCGYGCWIPPSTQSIARAARLPFKLTRETLKYLQETTGEVAHVYEGGANDDGEIYCTHGWVLSDEWKEENKERYEAAQKAEYERINAMNREGAEE